MKKHILLTLWALLMAVPCALARDIVLTDGWILQGKYPATVPSTVMGCLMANGEYAGILEGMGYKTVDRKSTRLNSSHANISYAVFCLKKKNTNYFRPSSRLSRS